MDIFDHRSKVNIENGSHAPSAFTLAGLDCVLCSFPHLRGQRQVLGHSLRGIGLA